MPVEKSFPPLFLSLCLAAFLQAAPGGRTAPAENLCGSYQVLPPGGRGDVPFTQVAFISGPREGSGNETAVWWGLSLIDERSQPAKTLCIIRALTDGHPFHGALTKEAFQRYLLRVPQQPTDQNAGNGPTFEYIDRHTGRALLPSWEKFTRNFFPKPVQNAASRRGFPVSCTFLGQVLSLRHVSETEPWKAWNDVQKLALDPELLIGTGRTVKDAENRRLPQKPERTNYTYVQWSIADYKTMIKAGMSIFGIAPDCDAFVRSQPVFFRANARGIAYPVDLYRSNFTGPVMYLDEPACTMLRNKTIQTKLKYFTDAAAVITHRVSLQRRDRSRQLETGLKGRGINLGDMTLVQTDFATWETRYETVFYQLEGGVSGFVHEGRYQLDTFTAFAEASTELKRTYSPREMFQYYFAFLRGAARHLDKDWGISIYGQADPELNPLAVTMAYDMGARHIWFWTSDHDHHLPWKEQLALSELITKRQEAHPRPSIRQKPKPVIDKAIVVPYGSLIVLESPTNRRNPWDLWWVRELDSEGNNEASKRYNRLRKQVMTEVHKAFDAEESFDIVVDDGRPVTGYRHVVRIAGE